MTKMKKLSLLLFGFIFLIGCRKEPFVNPPVSVNENLKISTSVGIKLESQFVTSEVAMNVKTETSQTVTIKIFDIANRVVSKSTSDVKSGDNILKVYTSALPSSAYRIGLFDSAGNLLGITDFNKL
jgi:PBP1b-binding outer membrane lipoprotein LpoB